MQSGISVVGVPGILRCEGCSLFHFKTTVSMSKNNAREGAGRYAFLLFDATFKVVVCTPENERLLIEILELLIPGKHIASITFVNKEKHGLVVSEKNVSFDLLCKDGDEASADSGGCGKGSDGLQFEAGVCGEYGGFPVGA